MRASFSCPIVVLLAVAAGAYAALPGSDPAFVTASTSVRRTVARPETAHPAIAQTRPVRASAPLSANGAEGLPLSFEPVFLEDGSKSDAFRARAGGYDVRLDRRGATFRRLEGREKWPAVLRLRLVGARTDHAPLPAAPPSGYSHYLRRADPGSWVTGVPRYDAIRWDDVYAGIDWIFRGDGGVAAYDFVVAPRADPSRIRLRLLGADHVAVDGAGNLVVKLGASRFTHSAPFVYQGDGAARRTVEGAFVVDPGADEVGFRIGAYDTEKELVIDPAIGFSSYLGGIASEDLPRIALGPDGGIFVVGTTSSDDFPVAASDDDAPLAGTPRGDLDVFVAKLDAAGTRLEFATYLGGSGMERGAGVAVASDGSVWVVGDTASTDFPATTGVFAGAVDGFVARLRSDGTALDFATLVGGASVDSVASISLDDAGAVYLAGTTTSDDFPTVDAHQAALAGPDDAFLVKLDATGQTVFSTYLGGATGVEAGFGVAADAAGNAWVTGSTESADFPMVNPVQVLGDGRDAFVAKFGPRGTLEFATALGGGAADVGLAIAVDAAGAAYVTGQTESPDFPTRSPVQLRSGGGPDAFVTKFAPDGGAVIYSTFLGGEGFDVGGGIAVDGSGNAHVTGMTSSPDFPTVDSLQPFFGGGSDVFVTRIDDRGTGITYSTFSGGAGADAGIGIAVDGSGNAYVAGQTGSEDFPTFNPVQGELGGPQDAFVTKYCLSLVFPDTRELGSASVSGSFAVTTPAGCVWIAFSQARWITLTSPNVVAGGDEVQFTLEPNATGAPRSGALNIAGKQVIVVQEAATGCEYEISPASENFHMEGGVGRINVSTSENCGWTARSNVDWIFLTSDSGTGQGAVSYRVEANRTGRQRSGTITVAGQTFVVFDWLREP